MLDSCCISIGLVFIKDRPVSSFWVLRFRVLDALFSRFRGLRLRLLGASRFGLRIRNYPTAKATVVTQDDVTRARRAYPQS